MALMGYRASIRNRELLKKVRKKPEEVGPSRARAAFEDAVEMTRARLLIKKYDEDNSGKLEIDDLKHLLIDLNYGKPVSDDEVRFILSSTDTQRDGAIDYDEIQFVLSIWSTYQRVLPELEDLMEHFDKDRSGRLERNEVHNLLIQLNEGKKVSDREVDFVMQEAGLLGDGKHISKPEIKRAIRAWYTAVEIKQQSKMCALL